MNSPETPRQKEKEVSDNIRNAFILAAVGVICFGFILGYLAFRKASDAIEIIDIYEVAKEKRGLAIAAKVIGILDIIGWALGLIARFALS